MSTFTYMGLFKDASPLVFFNIRGYKKDMNYQNSKVEEISKKVVEIISQRLNPERIILFGSYVEGRATADSDLDFLVVMQTQLPPLERQRWVRKALSDVTFPMDIFALTPEEFAETQDVIGGIAYPAVHYGKVLYEKP